MILQVLAAALLRNFCCQYSVLCLYQLATCNL